MDFSFNLLLKKTKVVPQKMAPLPISQTPKVGRISRLTSLMVIIEKKIEDFFELACYLDHLQYKSDHLLKVYALAKFSLQATIKSFK